MQNTISTPNIWTTPSFEEISVSMECTAYSGGDGDGDEFAL
ncbi:MAG TPA: pyrroloquinoline quinone precursor peptide PqqA [Opitutaceae bacterium]|jgi:coenzyme PQQ precursor peptide PqqA|nr:pyrroloquinoline quinone precursor peptide PqqA [Opitutaceae bacterium]